MNEREPHTLADIPEEVLRPEVVPCLLRDGPTRAGRYECARPACSRRATVGLGVITVEGACAMNQFAAQLRNGTYEPPVFEL